MGTIVLYDVDQVLFDSVRELIADKFPDIQVFSGNLKHALPVARLALPTQHEVEFVPVNQIIRIEGFKNYSTFTLRGRRPVTISKNLVNFERSLPASMFFRVHKSHIVNLYSVMRYRRQGGTLQMEDDSETPVSPGKREELLARLGQIGGSWKI